MKNKLRKLFSKEFLSALGLIALFCTGLAAQEVSTSSSGGSGSTASTTQTDTTTGGFDIRSSIEFGVRFKKVDGSEDKYRSDLNYKEGARLFDSTFFATAEESAGKPFDSLLVTGTGWGGDPNGFARISMEKIGWYKFDSTLRRFKYFNHLLNFALNEHGRNTVHNMGDFDITILPQNETVKFRAGFSYDNNGGPAESTFDYDRDEFPLELDYDTDSFDLRFGVDLNLGGVNLSFTEGYRKFEEDSRYFITMPQLGDDPSPSTALNTFSREMPTEGRTFYHRFTGHKYFKDVVDITGRFIYSDTKTDFTLNEMLTGMDRFGNTIVLDEFISSGDASRPNGTGDIGATFFVTDRFRISNTFGVNSYRISGGNTLLNNRLRNNPMQVPLPPAITNDLVWRFTNYRRIMNTLEGDVDVNRYFSFYLGYRYTDRKIEISGLDRDLISPSSSTFLEDSDNTTNTFLAGFKAKPIRRKWQIIFDMEHGEGDNPFTRLANNDFTQFRIRNRFTPTDDLSLTVSLETKDNSNPGLSETTPPTNFNADIKSRTVGVNMSWMPDPDFSMNGGYNYHYLNAETDVIFPTRNFGSGQGLSIYNLRNNFVYVDAWVRPHPRISIFGAYRISKDTGDGDDFIGPSRTIIGSYPLTFQSPEVRGTIKLFSNVDWNIGYQYYDYKEKFSIGQNYRAHLPYMSVRIYLGRRD